MTWFKVDDSFHSHPKAAAVSLAALGLWAVSGSWSGGHLTDGFVPDHMVSSLSRGQSELVKELCDCGLWRRAKGGYLFHQWTADQDGTKRNPTRAEVEDKRRKRTAAGRKGGLVSQANRANAQAPAQARASPLLQPPSRPLPSSKEGRGDARRSRGGGASPGDNSPDVDRHPYKPDPNGTCEHCGLSEANRRHREVS